jgi:DNA-binding transcriptional regulator YdaS (Cro superfamily)
MGAMDGRPRAVRDQVASVMLAAAKIVGGRAKLAERLKVEPYMVAEWIAKVSDAPDEAVHEAVEIILKNLDGKFRSGD